MLNYLESFYYAVEILTLQESDIIHTTVYYAQLLIFLLEPQRVSAPLTHVHILHVRILFFMAPTVTPTVNWRRLHLSPPKLMNFTSRYLIRAATERCSSTNLVAMLCSNPADEVQDPGPRIWDPESWILVRQNPSGYHTFKLIIILSFTVEASGELDPVTRGVINKTCGTRTCMKSAFLKELSVKNTGLTL